MTPPQPGTSATTSSRITGPPARAWLADMTVLLCSIISILILPRPGLARDGASLHFRFASELAAEYAGGDSIRPTLLELLLSHAAELRPDQHQALANLLYEHMLIHASSHGTASSPQQHQSPGAYVLSQLEIVPCGLLSATISLYSHGYAHLIELDPLRANIIIGTLSSIILALCAAS